MARWFDEREAKRRQAEQEAARAHEAAQESLRPASEQKVKTAPLVVNLDKQTNQSAARVASRIPDETERDGFLNESGLSVQYAFHLHEIKGDQLCKGTHVGNFAQFPIH